jgi:hypothetical protein
LGFVFVEVNRVQVLVLFFPHGRQKEFLAWDGQTEPVISGGPIDYRLVGSSVCHEICQHSGAFLQEKKMTNKKDL